MKLIQALKQVKDLRRKAEDLRQKISQNSAHLSVETPTYGANQAGQVAEWLQAHRDILKEIMRLSLAITRTNMETQVVIELGGKQIGQSIAAWVLRRRELAELDRKSWAVLTDKNLKEGFGQNSMGERVEVKLIRNFDPATRDKNVELFRSEPHIIDGDLEVVNAVTDLIE